MYMKKYNIKRNNQNRFLVFFCEYLIKNHYDMQTDEKLMENKKE